MAETSIEWTDWSINPIRIPSPDGKTSGHYCEKCSPGCANCYASTLQPVFFHLPVFEQRHGKTAGLFLDGKFLEKVLRRTKPTKIFWCDMTDMFGPWVPFEWIAACFGVMACTPHHTHQVLTKRAARMHEFFVWLEARRQAQGDDTLWTTCIRETMEHVSEKAGNQLTEDGIARDGVDFLEPWPLPNVWLGTSTENQATADERIPWLLKCPAAVRFVSAEPLLGAIDLTPWLGFSDSYNRLLRCPHGREPVDRCDTCEESPPPEVLGVTWVIIGGESGKKAREHQVEWTEGLVRQCLDAGTAVFVKQMGSVPTVRAARSNHWHWRGIKAPEDKRFTEHSSDRWRVHLTDKKKKGADMSEWPESLRVRQFPGGAL